MSRTHLVVLAGGFGTRLKSVVSDVPKILAPVHSEPFLKYQLQSWVNQGVDTITFLLHYQADKIISFINSWIELNHEINISFEYIIESQPLGTGGAIAHAVSKSKYINNNFYLVNADTWLGYHGLKQMFGSPMPSMGVVNIHNPGRYGQVKCNDGYIIGFDEKKSDISSCLINAGIYYLNCNFFTDRIGENFSLESDLFPKLISAGKFYANQLNTDFIDIGIPEDYFIFCKYIQEIKKNHES